jgi:hypothetical protein
MVRFLGSVSCPLPALETNFTPCGVWRPITADWIGCWLDANDEPLGGIRQETPGSPPALRPLPLLPRWRSIVSDEASTIGSVALLMAGSLAGPLRVAKVPL